MSAGHILNFPICLHLLSSRNGGVGPIRSKGPRGPAVRNAPKKPKTAEELDKELDTFMGDSTEATAPAAPTPDVEMA